MSKPIVVFGGTQLAELAHFYLTEDGGRRVAAFALDEAYLREDRFCGLPVVPAGELPTRFTPEEYELFVAIGYSKVNTQRRDKFRQVKAMGYTCARYIHSSSVVSTRDIGENCFIQEHNVIQPFAKLGDNVLLWVGNAVGHYAVVENHAAITSHVVVCGHTTIGEGAFIGVNATIRDFVRVGRYSVVGAGACILKDTEDHSVHASQHTPEMPIPSHALKSL